jgi:16S rRNA A1518/A1519 N6-dimethyltransferase RsmA/KsgA/DIM1 with predicted DNA glycosylase/AP lyase activity
MSAAGVGPGHVVLDLGSGDGALLLEAAARGARAVGYELDATLNAKVCPPLLPRTKRTRRVPHPVLIGHAALNAKVCPPP